MVLKSKMNLYSMEEKWRLKKVMESIRWDAPAEETLSESGRYMHHHHEYFEEIDKIVNTSGIKHTDTSRELHIARLYVIHEKLNNSDPPPDQEFMESFTNWIALLEMQD